MAFALLLVLAATMPEVPASTVQLVQEGEVLVVRNLIDDTPLYTFDLDEPGKSNCLAACAAEWRPLWAVESEKPVGKWTHLKRADGGMQWAYDGKPVYSFARDPEPVAIGGRTGNWQRFVTFPAH